MSTGTYLNGQLAPSISSGSGGHGSGGMTCESATVAGYDLRTVDQHIAQLESDIARLQQQIADQGMMIAQLREIVQGEPPFLQPEGNWHLTE